VTSAYTVIRAKQHTNIQKPKIYLKL